MYILIFLLLGSVGNASNEYSPSLCDLLNDGVTIVSENDTKGRVLYEFVRHTYPTHQVTFCLDRSEKNRVAHSESLVIEGLGLILGHIVQFNADFFSEAPIPVLKALAVHELVHRTDKDAQGGNDCMGKLAESVTAYTQCELEVDIRASAIEGVGECGMLESLRFAHNYWRHVAPGEKTTLDERIAWFEKNSPCSGI